MKERSKVEAVTYPEVKINVERKTGKSIALRTVETNMENLSISATKSEKELQKTKVVFLVFAMLASEVGLGIDSTPKNIKSRW